MSRYSATAQEFDAAFVAAREVGALEFVWRGFRYHTRRADETDEQWREKMKARRLTPPRSEHQPTHHKSAPQEGKV